MAHRGLHAARTASPIGAAFQLAPLPTPLCPASPPACGVDGSQVSAGAGSGPSGSLRDRGCRGLAGRRVGAACGQGAGCGRGEAGCGGDGGRAAEQ
eukprot:scaffold2811_cov134-Isochrysis_galbana.AAC.1